jgi:hypothetical protein
MSAVLPSCAAAIVVCLGPTTPTHGYGRKDCCVAGDPAVKRTFQVYIKGPEASSSCTPSRVRSW